MDADKVLYCAGASAVIYAACQILQWLTQPYRSPLRKLPGPPNPSWFFGTVKRGTNLLEQLQKWTDEYGTTFKFNGMFGHNNLFTMDPRTINHVIMHSSVFEKSRLARGHLSRLLGEGVLVAEGDSHRKQRRVMNPAFGPAQIREFTGVFLEKAEQLRDAWFVELSKEDNSPRTRVEVMEWLSRATLDIIGLAGFNYSFHALDDDENPNELNVAFGTLLRAGQMPTRLQMLQAMFPPLRVLPTAIGRLTNKAKGTMNRIGRELIAEKKAALNAEKEGANVAKGDVRTRDLLSLLVRANMAVDIPESQRLSDEEIIAQIPTFLVAGHETTSTGTSWALFALTQYPEVQRTLRAELQACGEAPSMDELQALPYLDAVVREVLRVHSPVPTSGRVAIKDDVLPLSRPIVDRTGVVRTEIPISAGDMISVPIAAINSSKEIWGDDAKEFRPERWQEPLPESASHMPGVWGNLLTFLGGPHACIGYRFSIVEMKALLFVLVRAFEFELAVPAGDVQKRGAIVSRPFVASEPEKGNQLPLLISPCVS